MIAAAPARSTPLPEDTGSRPVEPRQLTPIRRRDLIIIPLISLVTLLLLSAVVELLARQIWPQKLKDDCEYFTKLLGDRHRANCVTVMKNPEGPWVRYQMNNCGYRSAASCGPKPPGTLRLVIMGSSVAFGLYIPYDQYFAILAAPQLSKIWHHPVEVQNLGDVDWSNSDIPLNDMIALKPDAVIYMAVPYDLNRTDPVSAPTKHLIARTAEEEKSLSWTDVRLMARTSRALIVAQHFMLRDENFFLRAFAHYADPLDVSRVPMPKPVEERFERLDNLIGRLADRTQAARIPSFMIPLPNRIQSDLISKDITIPSMNAYAFPTRMGEIAKKHGMGYIDLVPELKKTRNTARLFYAVDGHPAAGEHSLMARVVVDYFSRRAPLR